MNLLDDIMKVLSDFEEQLSKKIKTILRENQKMAGNTHKNSERIVMPPNPVENPSFDLDINLNINIRPHIFEFEIVK